MSDDLVKRLWLYDCEGITREAADRIEELQIRLYQCASDLQIYMDAVTDLEAKVRDSALQELSALGQASEAYQAQLAAEARTVDLEAKLEKAMEALEAITFECVGDDTRCGSRAALEELKERN